MSVPRSRKPSFLWQAALMLLPVAALATVGLLSLRKDRLLTQTEAIERARSLADPMLSQVWDELTRLEPADAALIRNGETASLAISTNGARLFQVDATGRIVFPPTYEPVPEPKPLDVSVLSQKQREAWLRLFHLDGTPSHRAQACQAFLDLSPPRSFAALATYSLGLALSPEDPVAALRCFEQVDHDYPQASTESGVPLQPLAQLQLLRLSAHSGNAGLSGSSERWQSFCSNQVFHPTALTPRILEAARAQTAAPEQVRVAKTALEFWNTFEERRPVVAAAARKLTAAQKSAAFGTLTNAAAALPAGIWFESPVDLPRLPGFNSGLKVASTEEPWLALRVEQTKEGAWYACLSESECGERIRKAVEPQTPEYMGVGVQIAGRSLVRLAPDLHVWKKVGYINRRGGGLKKEYSDALATTLLASAYRFVPDRDELKLNVFLTSPSTLYIQQRSRTFWFGALIAASALAALVGLLGAYRAFHRQLRLSEMKSNFVSSVSHELRAPIASVRLMAESLESGKVADQERQHSYFRFISQECRRLSSLIENVLDFSRIEQGRKLYEFEPTDVVRLVRKTQELMEPYAAERQVQLRLELPTPEAVEAVLDGKAVQQALINLVDNALKHSEKGQTVTLGLEVRAQDTEASGGTALGQPETSSQQSPMLALWVEDQGEGIPAEEHERIFERFYRCGSELRRKTQGVGIGLSIVKHIVEAHHGSIHVRSAVGQGSRFTLLLPVGSPSISEPNINTNPDANCKPTP